MREYSKLASDVAYLSIADGRASSLKLGIFRSLGLLPIEEGDKYTGMLLREQLLRTQGFFITGLG